MVTRAARIGRARRAGPFATVAAVGAALALAAACGAGGDNAGDDQRIAFVREGRLLVRAPGGAERVVWTADRPSLFPAFPAWSPDGTRIAFSRVLIAVDAKADWGDDLVVVPREGREPRVVRAHAKAGHQIQGVAWTPDGSALLVGARQTTVVDGRLQGVTHQLERVDGSTGATTVIARDAVEPSISRDGSRIAFLVIDERGGTRLAVANADGRGARVLATPPEFEPVLAPRIAPDGRSLAFTAPSTALTADSRGRHGGAWPARLLGPLRPRAARAHGVPMEVWRIDVDSGAITRLTNFAEDDPRAAWTPDGATLYVIAAGGMYEVAADGSKVTRLGAGGIAAQLDLR
ncbi:MAG: hypothetical protein FJZ92_12465 [Chloroflexi bacterium]|nr:hypothetical protein [Chloroflexota bacterium]